MSVLTLFFSSQEASLAKTRDVHSHKGSANSLDKWLVHCYTNRVNHVPKNRRGCQAPHAHLCTACSRMLVNTSLACFRQASRSHSHLNAVLQKLQSELAEQQEELEGIPQQIHNAQLTAFNSSIKQAVFPQSCKRNIPHKWLCDRCW